MSDNIMVRERADVGSYEDIVAAAERTTGMSDFGGTAHEEGLRVLVEDLASPEAGLTPRGNYFQRSEVKSALVGVLLTQAQFAAHPEHRDVRIERPVFLMGLPRTGTTALHRYLHADPATQGLEMWLTQYPQPRPPRETWEQDPIFNAMQQAFTAHHVESPDFMGIHYMDATTVEECWRLLRQTGKSNSYESLANLPRYSQWLQGQDWTDAYARHKQNLQLVGLNDPDKRWILKNPSHMTALDALMTVYPDALVVYTHRDPVTCIASSASLSAETTAGHSETYVGGVIGHTQLDLWSRAFHAFHDARPKYDQAQFADVAFADLRKDPLGVTRGDLRAVRARLDAGGGGRDHRGRPGVEVGPRGAEARLLAQGLRAHRATGEGGLRPMTTAGVSRRAQNALLNHRPPWLRESRSDRLRRAGVRDVGAGGRRRPRRVPESAAPPRCSPRAWCCSWRPRDGSTSTTRCSPWLPGLLPASYPTVTVGQLLDHTSGLPESTEDAGTTTRRGWCGTGSTGTRRGRGARRPPGSRWRSRPAQAGVQRRQLLPRRPGRRAGTGHSYAHELRTRLLEPLRLDDTYLPGRGQVRLRGPHTHGYVRVDDRLVDVTEQSAYAWAEGGMVSTTRDLGGSSAR